MKWCRYGTSWLACAALIGCGGGDDGDGGEEGPLPCTARGAAVAAPADAPLALAAVDGVFHLAGWLPHDGFGDRERGLWRLDEAAERIADAPEVMASDGATLFGVASDGVTPDVVQLLRWDGADWTEVEDGAAPSLSAVDFDAGTIELAVGANGTRALLAVERNFGVGCGVGMVASVAAPGAGFGAWTPVFAAVDGACDRGVELRVDGLGGVHILGETEVETRRIAYRHRSADGRWNDAVDVGPSEGGSFTRMPVDLAVTRSGRAFVTHVIEAAPRSDGGVTVYRLEGATAEQVARVADDRFVASSIAAAAIGERVLVATTHGENHIDAEESDDSVDLLLCDAEGCERALRPTDARGVFYDDAQLIVDGDQALLVWHQSPKSGVDVPEGTRLLRIGCAP